MQKSNLQEQKAEERLLDADSVLTASIKKNSQLLSHDLLDTPIPLQSPVVSTDSPIVSSGSNVGFSLQFSFKDLMSKRKQRLTRLQCIRLTSKRMNLER